MGGMSAVAKANPKAIADAFTQNKDGTYTVRLFDLKGKPHFVTVDADLPRNGWYGYYYARAHDPKELWPAILEKAVAKWKGSYGAIEAGVPGDAMSWITGKKSADIDMRGKGVTADQVFNALTAAVKSGKPAIAATLSDSEDAKYKGNRHVRRSHVLGVRHLDEERSAVRAAAQPLGQQRTGRQRPRRRRVQHQVERADAPVLQRVNQRLAC